MFSIKKINEHGFSKVILQDDTGTIAEILPSCGAILHAFIVPHNGRTLNVIEGYDSEADFKANVTARGFRGSKLSPFACRLKNAAYHFGQQQYQIKKFLLGPSAIHGLLFDAIFTLTGENVDETKASIKLKHEYRGEDGGYPFSYDCLVEYILEKDNRLSVNTSIINKSEGLIPVQDGWHPYFTLGEKIDELQLEFQSKEMLEFDEGLLPTGKLLPYRDFTSLKKIGNSFFDNCFTVNFAECQPMCVLRNTKENIQVEIHPSRSYPYLQIYTPPHRASIAIENLSAAPDAFNNGMGLITVAAGGSATFETIYKITSLS